MFVFIYKWRKKTRHHTTRGGTKLKEEEGGEESEEQAEEQQEEQSQREEREQEREEREQEREEPEKSRWLLLALAVLATHRNANACARSSCAELSIINAAIFGMTSAFASCRTKSSEQKENGSRWQVCHMRFLD